MIISYFKKHFLLFVFLFLYFIFAIFTYKDYGATADEWTEKRAVENLSIYLKLPTSYESINNKKYHDNLDYEFGHHPLVSKYQRSYQLLQNALNFKDYYEWGHLINLVFGSVIFIVIYCMFFVQYKSSTRSILPVAFLVLCGRFLGDIPTNNKDIPFAILYIACLASIYFLSSKAVDKNLRIILLGLLFGLTQTFRTVGFSIYFVYLGYFLYSNRWNIKEFLDFILELFIIAVFSLFVSVSLFPWLGSNFFANFYSLLLDAKSFGNWDDTIFFEGKFLFKGDRPWYYLFTWIFITTPVFILGLIFLIPFKFRKLINNKLFVVSLLAFFVNILLYLFLQPVVYNGIRHFLFLVPLMVIMSSVVLYEITKNKKAFVVFSAFILLNAVSILRTFTILHPYEYIYFNELIGGLKGASGRYELDYWGATYKEATDWIVNNADVTQADIIYSCGVDYAVDYYSGKKFFMTFGYPENANYTICDRENEKKLNFDGKVLFRVVRDGVVLNTVREYEKTN